MNRYALCAALALALSPLQSSAAPGDKPLIVLPVLDSTSAVFDDELMTGPAQTNVFDVRGLDYVQFFLSAHTVTGTASVSVDCYIGPSSADANYHVQSESISLGVATSYDYVPTHSVTTSDKWVSVVPTQRASYMYCTFAAASGKMDITVLGGNF